MNKQSIIGLVLIFVVMMGYAYLNSPSVEERKAMEEQSINTLNSTKLQDSIAKINSQNISDSTSIPLSSSLGNGDSSLTTSDTASDVNNPFALASRGDTTHYQVSNEVFVVDFQAKGGRIASILLKDYLTYEKKPLYLFDAKESDFYLSFFANNRSVSTENLYFECLMPTKTEVKGKDSAVVRMRLYPNTIGGALEGSQPSIDKSKYIEFVYTIRGDQYMLGFDINIVQMQNEIAANTNFIDLTWKANLHQIEKALNMESMNTAVYYKPINDKVDYLKETKDDAKELTTPLKWVSFKQQFFSLTLIANKDFLNADIKNFTEKEAPKGYLKSLQALIGIPYQNVASQSVDMQIYAGPNKYRTMRNYQLDLERQIPLGWSFFLMQWINRIAVIPTFDYLSHWGLSYGLIILILTILLKIFLFPITYKSYLSSAKMRVIQPEVTEINKKFPKQEQAMDKQKATMALYKKAGINPMAGCIPMLLQFPILLAMFRFFPASIELRQQPFLWADDLSSYDSICSLPFNIPFYGDHISLFAILMAVSNLFYTRMTMKQTASTNQMPGMKFMMYAMPIMFLGFLNSYSAALNYYYFLSTIITFLQMWIIRQFIVNDEKVLARIQENKKKPVKKSKFQARLEEMAKKQQAVLSQQQKQKGQKRR
ncbi:MAG: membrane protein insertase YidC [Bacteroidales bacterium]